MNTEKTTSERCAELVATLIIFFLYPLLLMMGWNEIALGFNAPQFDYWTVFCIAHGLRYILNSHRK